MNLRSLLLAVASVVAGVAAAPAQESRAADEARVIADRIAHEVADVRGLAYLRPTDVARYSTAELKAFLLKGLDRDFPPERRAVVSRALKAFGLLPADYDLGAGLVELLTDQVAGFYDPATRELRLVRRDPSEESGAEGMEEFGARLLGARGIGVDDVTMAHELTHALQDQHFDLRSLPLEVEDDDDLATAARCVVEGDATVAMTAWTFRRMKMQADAVFSPFFAKNASKSFDVSSLPGGGKLNECPPYLRESLVFPYLGGLEFCLAVALPSKSFAPIDAALRDPPRSTEQILHPEKYAGPGRDDPYVLALPDLAPLLGPGARLATTNVLGEFGCRVWFEGAGAAPDAASSAPTTSRPSSRAAARERRRRAERAAAGWDGDRYALYVRDGGPDVLVWASTWDGEEDAAEAAEAAAAALPSHTKVEVRRRGVDVLVAVVAGDGPVDRAVPDLARVLDAAAGFGREERTRVVRKEAPK